MISRKIFALFVFTLLYVADVSAAAPGAPVAIVEEVDAAGVKVGFMEYLEEGSRIALGKRGRLVVGYFKSCLRETIIGGTVTIGAGQSATKGGDIKRERVECDGGQMKLSAAQSGKSGVVVMRKAPTAGSAMGMATPEFRIFGTRPVITLSKAGTPITITRLDKPDAPLHIGTTRTIVDLAEMKKGLAIGGLYRAQAGDRSVVFSVDAFASDGMGDKAGPAIGRLIRL